MEAREEYDFVAATFAVGLDQRFDLSEVGLVVEEPAAATSLHMWRTLEIFAFRSETVDIQTWIWQNLVLNASDSELFLPGFGGSSPSAFETEAFLLPVSLASGEHALRARDYH
ncbi:hypothetical protein C8Q72DRAFT_883101 [Fomitopsis betulina]|nr:hypothetical protein C8Q72DRAFT_883101 [Fomitopsis betulina]